MVLGWVRGWEPLVFDHSDKGWWGRGGGLGLVVG